MSEITINFEQIQILRQRGTITENETAFLEGDILLAKNVLTEKRRIIGKITDLLNESTKKRILKD